MEIPDNIATAINNLWAAATARGLKPEVKIDVLKLARKKIDEEINIIQGDIDAQAKQPELFCQEIKRDIFACGYCGKQDHTDNECPTLYADDRQQRL